MGEEASQPFFQQAVELGVTFWDTANVYGLGSTEEFVGRAIKTLARREEIVLATKVSGKMHGGPGGSGLSREAILEQIDASLVVSAPIVCATKPHHLAGAVAALDVQLSDDEIGRLEEPYTTLPAYLW
ncbi:aldo/keto reductase [Kribbella qitaiheensis]|uniref:aldo/keto reductase n=1 Tax=Kribbella qitaiheensis TaxID=1544730 RepID=UPI001FE61EBE|nr:aldo/keto reductase [Kribbella qitaiheensis]